MRWCLIIFAFLINHCLSSQNNGDSSAFRPVYQNDIKYIVKTTFGTTHTGYIVRETADSLIIENKNIKTLTGIAKRDVFSIKTMERIKRTYEEEKFSPNYHANNYLFSTTAFEFEEGAITSQNHWFILQSIDYAINDNWAATTNAIAFFPLSLGLKCAYRVGDRDFVGASGFAIGNPLNSDPNAPKLWGYGFLGRYTRGTSNRNVTLSAGVLGINTMLLYNSNRSNYENLVFINGGYCTRLSRQVALVAEGWYLPASQISIGGLGIKLVENEYYSWSFGCYAFMDINDRVVKVDLNAKPIPYLGIARKFK